MLLAEWLAVCNLLRRAKPHAAIVLIATAGVLGALAVILLTFGPRFAAAFDGLLTYRVLTIAAVAIYAAPWVASASALKPAIRSSGSLRRRFANTAVRSRFSL